ncbi:hypothetical protein T310_3145 [Rasamsonia emersonii CBS 393.64]|uniref:Uncharacterized protein n=1 Tax=Rasamsonia emersonii (strain ATCC 16479 / CBS 393.64 / IMI 116815) TaxID=1408163 RepID=A0A0F4YWY7_RASE3|nr:hypothetical protein T310_3145 [Rasamsonia emersonii CBS 393.64]KKA22817.1 hypothetical protein T310_3145 [Rasamsonia emersonii CBS 393.64]
MGAVGSWRNARFLTRQSQPFYQCQFRLRGPTPGVSIWLKDGQVLDHEPDDSRHEFTASSKNGSFEKCKCHEDISQAGLHEHYAAKPKRGRFEIAATNVTLNRYTEYDRKLEPGHSNAGALVYMQIIQGYILASRFDDICNRLNPAPAAMASKIKLITNLAYKRNGAKSYSPQSYSHVALHH